MLGRINSGGDNVRKTSKLDNVRSYIKEKIFVKRNQKKIAFFTIIVLVILLGNLIITSSHKYSQHIYHEGKYTGIAQGYHSDIEVEVLTDKYRILQINVTKHKEMPVISEVVFKEIPYKVIRENSTDVDMVSGATYTSEGLINALNDAINKAKDSKMEEY